MFVKSSQKILRGLGLLLVAAYFCAFTQPSSNMEIEGISLSSKAPGSSKIDLLDLDGLIPPSQIVKITRPKRLAYNNNQSHREWNDPDVELNSINSITHAQEVMQNKSGTCAICDLAASAGAELEIRRTTTRSMAPRCSALMDSNGKLGEGGRSLMSIMSESQYVDYYTRSNSLGAFCPKFNELSKPQKLEAWTWFWTALAQEEASCRVNLVHGTSYMKNGKMIVLNPREGYGLWALERDRNIRRSRGAACSNIGNIDGQARCSIDIMVKTQLSKGASASTQMGYWGPVRRESKDHQLMPHMRRFSLCF